MWFEELVGFREENPDQVRDNLIVNNGILTSRVTEESFRCGGLETPTLEELRIKTQSILDEGGAKRVEVSETVGDVQRLHKSRRSKGALFQVASQFNLLEMVGPGVTPERGVDGYEYDHTQGPACAIACGAGTIYRNYYATTVDGQIGQTVDSQVDCLHDIGLLLDNSDNRLWKMRNGYALATTEGLEEIGERIATAGGEERNDLRGKLRIGLQLETEVTLGRVGHTVTQAYCSAMPVSYSGLDSSLWQPFACLVLEAAYEATLRAALINREENGRSEVYLTLLGGGAFGNQPGWIIRALQRALTIVGDCGLEVRIVSYGRSNPDVAELVKSMRGDSDSYYRHSLFE